MISRNLIIFAPAESVIIRKSLRYLIMINRDLIRIKVVQLVYSYYQNPDKSMASVEKELLFSLSKSYDMYRYLLMLIGKV